MITLVGIRHTEVMDKQLENLLFDLKPNVIGVELDRFRYRMKRGEVSEEELGLYRDNFSRVYKMISLFKYRSQMKSGVKRDWEIDVVLRVSEEINADVVPVDMDQALVYRMIEENISFEERIRLMFSLFCRLDFGGKQDEEGYGRVFSKKFPTLKRYLIDERNRFMAGEIKKLSQRYRKVLVVVGNAHLDGIVKLFKGLSVKLVDVDSLREL